MLRATLVTAALSFALHSLPALAQASADLKNETITMVVPYAPGGASDRAARIVAEGMHSKLGATIIVENKTGAGGRIAAQYVKNAGADKNMLLLANPAVMVVAPLVFKDLAYDPVKDFRVVSMVTQYGFGVAVAAQSEIKDLPGLIDWAVKHPGQFNIGVPATGSLPHFFGLMLAQKIGAKAEIIGYRGSAPVLTDLIGGALPIAIDTLDVLTKQHHGERIRILATSGSQREETLPDVPTFTEGGVLLEAAGWNAFFASSGMSDEKIQAFGKAIKEVTADPSVQKTLLQSDLIPVVADSQESAALLDAFREQWEPVVQESNFVVNK